MLVKNPAYKGQDKLIPVRCGKCEGCLKSKINDWAFRLEQEAKRSLHVHFVTLTYSPAYVPLTETLLHTLKKTDVQKFIKRLRKRHEKLKYFAVGEYGSRSHRPHYHLIIYNVSDETDIHSAWSINKEEIGGVHIGNTISDGAIPYTLKYMYKKSQIPQFKEDDRLHEFRLMSKKLGSNYLTSSAIQWHLNDLKNRQYVTTKNGIKVALPRYFREQLIELSGRHRSAFRNEDSVYMTSEDKDYRSLSSRVEQQKNLQRKFEKTRNQEERKKL